MTLPALIASLRYHAAIAASTDRSPVFAEAADRLEALAADGERLDWLQANHGEIWTVFQVLPQGKYLQFNCSAYRATWHCAPHVRDAIDRARENADA